MLTAAFAKIEAKTKYSMIIDQIMELLQNGVYKPGDKLPNERLMAEALGVSRGALRESLKALLILGILESRQGDGTYVSSTQSSPDLQFGFLGDADIEEIIQLRRIIELGCATEGIEQVTDDDIASLEARLDEMHEAGKGDNYRAYLEASHEFHLNLSKTFIKTANRPLENLLEYLWKKTNLAITREIHEDYMRGRISEHIASHEKIIETLRVRSMQGFIAAIRAHYNGIIGQLR